MGYVLERLRRRSISATTSGSIVGIILFTDNFRLLEIYVMLQIVINTLDYSTSNSFIIVIV